MPQGGALSVKGPLIQIAAPKCCSKTRDTAANHGTGSLFNARNVSGGKNSGNRGGSDGIYFRHKATWTVQHFAACDSRQLTHGGQTHSDTDGVHIQMLLGARNGGEVTVYLSDDSIGHMIRALCFDDGMTKEYNVKHPKTSYRDNKGVECKKSFSAFLFF